MSHGTVPGESAGTQNLIGGRFMRRSLVGKLAATAALAAAMIAPSVGSATLSQCPSQNFCAWTASNYSGTVAKQIQVNNPFWNTTAGWNVLYNNDRSWYNHGTSGLRACVYDGTGGGPPLLISLAMGQAVASAPSPTSGSGASSYFRSSC
jgi:Peptidase inhibitor family I36